MHPSSLLLSPFRNDWQCICINSNLHAFQEATHVCECGAEFLLYAPRSYVLKPKDQSPLALLSAAAETTGLT